MKLYLINDVKLKFIQKIKKKFNSVYEYYKK